MTRTPRFPASYRRYIHNRLIKPSRSTFKAPSKARSSVIISSLVPDQSGKSCPGEGNPSTRRRALKEECERLSLELIKAEAAHALLLKLLNDKHAREVVPARAKLREAQRRYQLETGIHIVPNEVLALILLFSVSGEVIPDAGPKGSSLGALQLVCRRWRELCLHTPRLWTYWNMSFPGTVSDQVFEGMSSMICAGLERSKTWPVSVEMTPEVFHAPQERFSRLLDIFGHSPAHVQSLYLILDHHLDLLVSSSLATSFPHLRFLYLQRGQHIRLAPLSKKLEAIDYKDLRLELPSVPRLFASIRALRIGPCGDLVVRSLEAACDLISWAVDSDHSTAPTRGMHRGYVDLQLLEDMPLLQHLRVWLPTTFTVHSTLSLVSLRRLCIWLDAEDDHTQTFQHLLMKVSLPGLRELHMERCTSHKLGDGDEFLLQAIEVVVATLSILSFRYVKLEPLYLRKLLEKANQLQELLLCTFMFAKENLQLLSANVPMLCPKLNRLDLTEPADLPLKGPYFELRDLVNMLSCRNEKAEAGACSRILRVVHSDTLRKGSEENSTDDPDSVALFKNVDSVEVYPYGEWGTWWGAWEDSPSRFKVVD